jgi:hypothetical protein
MKCVAVQDVPLIIENGLNVSGTRVVPTVITTGAAFTGAEDIGNTSSAEEMRMANEATDKHFAITFLPRFLAPRSL